jgi:hypothetical protein
MTTSTLAPRPFVLVLAALAASALGCGGASTSPPAGATAVTASQATTPGGASATGSALLTPAGSAGSQKAERRKNPAWATCHASYKADATNDLVASVDTMAKACADTTKMHMLSSFKGQQSASNLPQTFAFHADANHCYRAYAVAAATIQDLDLLIKDSTGAVAGEDSTDDPTPVVLEDGAVCFNTADDASVVVSIGAGNGAYAVQVWSD